MRITIHCEKNKPESGIPATNGATINGLNLGWLITLLQAKLQDGTADSLDISELDCSISARRMGDEQTLRRQLRATIMFTLEHAANVAAPANQIHQTWQQAREHAEEQLLYWQSILDGIENTMPKAAHTPTTAVRRVFWVQELVGNDMLARSENFRGGWYEHTSLEAPKVGDHIKVTWAGRDQEHVIVKVSDGMIQVQLVRSAFSNNNGTTITASASIEVASK